MIGTSRKNVLFFYTRIGAELKKQRLNHKLTLVEVSKKIDVSPKQVQNYENGVNKMSILILVDLCNLYGIDYVELITRSIQELDK